MTTAGLIGAVACFIWWAIFYTDVVRAVGGRNDDLFKAFSCFYSNAGLCGFANLAASRAGHLAYDAVFLWLSGGSMIVGMAVSASSASPGQSEPAPPAPAKPEPRNDAPAAHSPRPEPTLTLSPGEALFERLPQDLSDAAVETLDAAMDRGYSIKHLHDRKCVLVSRGAERFFLHSNADVMRWGSNRFREGPTPPHW